MELGSGLGPNIAFLARRNPHVVFDGVDLSNKPLNRNTTPSNAFFIWWLPPLKSIWGRFVRHYLHHWALCYATDKSRVLHEARRKLRAGGLLIVFDGYQRGRVEPLNPSEGVMWGYIKEPCLWDDWACTSSWRLHAKEFSIIEVMTSLSAYCHLSSGLRV